MGSASNYLENKLLDHPLKTAAYTQPTNIYVSLHTADPTDAASGAEASGGSYARTVCNTWNAAASRQTSNTGVVTFPTATGSWGTITHWALWDASSAGNMLAHGSFTTSNAVVSTNIFTIPANELDIIWSAGGYFDYLVHKLLDHVFKTASYTPATNLYMALSTTTPADNGTNVTEPSGNNYSRKNFNTWNAAASGATDNNGAITMATPSGSWGTITYGALYDASTTGNPLMYGSITGTAITTGNILEWASGAYDVTQD